jgi:hypothetical protein
MTASGLREKNRFPKHNFNREIVYRFEPDYAGALCTYGTGSPKFTALDVNQTFWAFTSTTTAYTRLRGQRVLVLAQRPTSTASTVYTGGTYLYPLGYVEQMEVTLPPGTQWKFLACQRTSLPKMANVALLYGYDITAASPLSPSAEQTLLKVSHMMSQNVVVQLTLSLMGAADNATENIGG